jgi:hypothetical protein
MDGIALPRGPLAAERASVAFLDGDRLSGDERARSLLSRRRIARAPRGRHRLFSFPAGSTGAVGGGHRADGLSRLGAVSGRSCSDPLSNQLSARESRRSRASLLSRT